MKNILHIAIASMVALAMVAFPADTYAQARRSNGGRGTAVTQNTNSSSDRSTVSRSSGSTDSRGSVSRSRGSDTRSSVSRSRSSSSRSSSPTVRGSAQDNTTRRGTAVTRDSRRSGSYSRGGGSDARSSVSRSRGSVSRSSGTRVARPVDQSARSSARGSYTRSSSSRSSAVRNDARDASARVGNVTRGGLSASDARRGSLARETRSDFMRIGEDRNVFRIPPRERDFLEYSRPSHFWGYHPHYYGYRVNYLPPRFRRLRYWGVDYCFYDGIYYRPFADYYIVCRPPFGITFALDLMDIPFAAVNFAYYGNVYRTYRAIDANNRLIDEQNRIIAQNNATLAAQNNAIALNSNRANAAYSLADRLGLVQSYAYATQPYYYQDGVFYIVNGNNEYEVIVPPAGALVSELPDDYDTISMDGMDFYKVDDTVYRLTLVDGAPYLEVLGQMYGNLAQKYNYYANGQNYNNLY